MRSALFREANSYALGRGPVVAQTSRETPQERCGALADERAQRP
jgi:hypothetical protein